MRQSTIAAIVLLVLSVVPALGQTSSNTLSETTTWIETNLGGAACGAYTMGRSRAELQQYIIGTEVRFSGCEMIMEYSSSSGPRGIFGAYRVRIDKLDPSRIATIPGIETPAGWMSSGTILESGIRLVTVNDEKIIDAKSENFGDVSPNPTETKISEIRFHVRDQEAAAGLIAAFSHAIKLCVSSSALPVGNGQ